MLIESSLQGAYSLPLVLVGAYGAGILASFTPCIYPMIPITMGIISAQRTHSMLANFFLSLSYGLGIATVYATLGYLSVKSNLMFGQWLANPFFIIFNIAFFIYLAGSMFGWYEMYTPQFAQPKQLMSRSGSYLYSFSFGLFSGTAASPCLTPALALLLNFAGSQQNALVGISVLFAFAMGLSTLLIVIGTFSSALTFLPRAGSWMDEVKKIFGFLLIAVCITYLEPLTTPEVVVALYGLLSLSASAHYLIQVKQKTALRYVYALLSLALFFFSLYEFKHSYNERQENYKIAHE